MAERLKMGIVGTGGIGTFHSEIMQTVDNMQLVAVCDIIPSRAQQVGEKLGIAWYGDYDDMLADSNVEAVSVCTPSGLHADHGILAAKAGKHVLSEKPMDVYVEKIDQLVAACAANMVTLGGIFQNRFGKNIQQVKRAIEDGWLGELVYARGSCLWFRTQAYYDSGDWRGTWALDGGALSNQGIHTLDRLLWLTGMQPEVLAAYCPTLQRNMEAEDLGIALLKFPNGAGGTLDGTTLANPGFATRVEICGSKGSVIIEDAVTFFHAEGAPEGLVDVMKTGELGGAADPAAAWGPAHAANMTEFANAVLEGREPWVNAAEARKAVQLLNDIYQAAQVGRWAEASSCCCGGGKCC